MVQTRVKKAATGCTINIDGREDRALSGSVNAAFSKRVLRSSVKVLAALLQLGFARMKYCGRSDQSHLQVGRMNV